MLANAGCGRTAVISRIAQWLVGRLEWHRVAGWPVSSLAGFAGRRRFYSGRISTDTLFAAACWAADSRAYVPMAAALTEWLWPGPSKSAPAPGAADVVLVQRYRDFQLG